MEMKTLLTAVVTGAVGTDVTTIPNYCPLNSNVGQYPIAVTLGANPNYSVVSTNGI
jgi:hypothetical protein